MCKKVMKVVDPLGSKVLDTPKAPRVEAPPPPPPAPPAPPDIGTPPAVPGADSPEAQAAAAQAKAEADARRRKSTFLTGAGGISKQKFGNPSDVTRKGLYGSA